MHVIDITGGFEGRDPVEDYRVINEELRRYATELADRPQIVVANKCDVSGMEERIAELRRAVAADGRRFFAVSAVTGAGLQTLMLAVGEQVAELRRALAEEAPGAELSDRWERRRQAREKRFQVVCEEPGVYRVLGTQVERLVVQTDWDNEEALIYLQHRFARMGVDDALEKAGCRPGDEVRIVGRAFTFEGAEEYLDETELGRIARRGRYHACPVRTLRATRPMVCWGTRTPRDRRRPRRKEDGVSTRSQAAARARAGSGLGSTASGSWAVRSTPSTTGISLPPSRRARRSTSTLCFLCQRGAPLLSRTEP